MLLALLSGCAALETPSWMNCTWARAQDHHRVAVNPRMPRLSELFCAQPDPTVFRPAAARKQESR